MKFYTIVTIAISLLVFSCKKDPKKEVAPAHQAAKDLNLTKETISVEFANADLTTLYNDYLHVKAALVNTDAKRTQKEAQKLAKDLEGKEALTNARQVAVLMAKEKDVKKQREFFVGLTNEVLASIQGNITKGKVIQQMCPMAFEGKGGFWLSNSKEIRNPYYGDEMLACGAVMKEFGVQ